VRLAIEGRIGGFGLEIFRELGIDPQLIVVNIIAFLVLLWLLKKFLFRPVTEVLESRREEIRSSYEAAERDRTAAAELRQDYERRLAGIEAEAREKIQAAIRDGQEHRDHLLSEARAEAERVLRRGQEELQREYAKTLVQLREEVVNLAIESSRKLIERSLDDATHRALIAQFIESIEARK